MKGRGKLSSQRNKEVVLGFYEEVLGKGQLDRIPVFIAQDAINHTPQSQTLAIIDDIHDCLNRLKVAFPDFRILVQDIVTERDIVVVRSSFVGTHQADFMGIQKSGRVYRIISLHWFRVVDMYIVEHWGICHSLKQSISMQASI